MELSEEQKAAVYCAVGQASLCWINAEGAGEFMAELAVKVGRELIATIEGWGEE